VCTWGCVFVCVYMGVGVFMCIHTHTLFVGVGVFVCVYIYMHKRNWPSAKSEERENTSAKNRSEHKSAKFEAQNRIQKHKLKGVHQ
jgi:hypothetical protein